MNNLIKIPLQKLIDGKTILYPTDTVWGIGCDASNKMAIEKIYTIKKRHESKNLVLLINNLKMLKHYIEEIPFGLKDYLSTIKKPTTIIYNNPKNVPANLIAENNTIAIRITKDRFCYRLIESLGKPIVSTSANISGQSTPMSFNEIDKSILASVDYVVNLHQDNISTSPSVIVKFNCDGKAEIIRS
jgi:L-threonylcarbamoyladenylate synthase